MYTYSSRMLKKDMFGLDGNPCEIDDRVLYLYN